MAKSGTGMSGHHATEGESEVWLTPPWLLAAVGGAESFALDPCSVMEPRPWPTARQHYTRSDNGLLKPWHGRVWMNPPYGPPNVVRPWMSRLMEHGQGLALIFARTETEVFFDTVWRAAHAVLFLEGRLFFHRPDGTEAPANAGAPSCLVAYGAAEAKRLSEVPVPGHFVPLSGTKKTRGLELFTELV